MALNVDFQGVWTNPNPHSKVPAGATRIAENVVSTRPGVASTVPGMENLAAYSASDERFSSGISYQGCLVEHTQDAFDGGAEDAYLYVRDPSTGVLTPQANVGDPAYAVYPPTGVKRIPFAIAGDKLYLLTSEGLKVKDGVGEAPASVGLPVPFALYYSIPGALTAFTINPGEGVAYRAEIRRKDSDGNYIISAPSGRTEVVNTASGTKASGTVTLSGSANNVTVVFNGITIGPVAAGANDTATALDLATAFNLTPAAVDIATVGLAGPVMTIRAKSNGTYANAFTLTASSTSGSAVASGATLSGGSGGDTSIITKNYLPTGLQAGDEFRLYRTSVAASGVPAGDIMYLVHVAFLSSSEVSTRYHEWTDDTPDEARGEPLYTNGTQESIVRQNERPPYAEVMLGFDDSLLLANVRGPQRFTVRLIGLPDDGDTLTIAGTVYTASSSTEAPLTGTFQIYSTSSTVSKQIEDTAKSLILAINRYASNTSVFAYYQSGTNDPPGIIGIEARDVTITSFTMQASANGERYEPPIDTAQASDAVTEPNGIWVSKRGQHYAFPPLRGAGTGATYRFRVGVKGNPILAMAQLREAVIVFVQNEGVFRVQRAGESWRVDQISNNAHLLVPSSVGVVDNRVIALTTRGLVAVDISGVEEIDLPIKDQIDTLKGVEQNVLQSLTFAVTDEGRLRYTLYHPLTNASTTSDHAWVYNGDTDLFTERTDAASGGMVGEDDGLLYLGAADSNHLTRERTGSASAMYKRPDNTAIPVRLKWTVMDEGDPGAMKQYAELRLLTKDSITGNVTFNCTNDLGGSESTTGSTSSTGEPYVRVWVPDGCQMTSRLDVEIQRSVLGQTFEVVGLKALVPGVYDGGLTR